MAWVKTGKNSANSGTITFSPTNTGDFLAWFSSTSSGAGATITSVIDNNNVSWSQAIATFQDASTAFHCTMYYLQNCEAGITTATATFNGGSTPGTCDIWVAEWSGIAATGALITTASAVQTAPGTSTNAATSNAVNVSTTPAIIAGFICDTQNTGTIAAGTGFTSRSSTAGTGRLVVEDLTLNSPGSQAATGTPSNGTDVFFSCMLALLVPQTGPIPQTGVTAGDHKKKKPWWYEQPKEKTDEEREKEKQAREERDQIAKEWADGRINNQEHYLRLAQTGRELLRRKKH